MADAQLLSRLPSPSQVLEREAGEGQNNPEKGTGGKRAAVGVGTCELCLQPSAREDERDE